MLSFEDGYLATELLPYDIYHLLPKKKIPFGYEPITDPADRRIGAMVEAQSMSGAGASGKIIKQKQVCL